MKRIILASVALVTAMACEAQPTKEPQAAAAPTAAPAQPSPEEQQKAEAEKKKAEEAEKLKKDFEQLQATHEKELARWTPELRQNAKSIADKSYPNGKAAITAAIAGKYRTAEHSERDSARHPAETLAFFGLEPSMKVLEYGPGGGWYTELLAPALSKKGKLFITNQDPEGPKDQRTTYYAQRTKLMLDRAPELYSNVETIVFDPKQPDLKLENELDLALVIRGLHGMVNGGTLSTWLSEIHTALKPKGVLGIVQHRAAADAKPEESSKKGYLPEAWVIEQVEKAGFKLAAKSEINANAKDTKDHPSGVWTLPPTYALKDQDREKYAAIGESDRMTLKFEKVAAK